MILKTENFDHGTDGQHISNLRRAAPQILAVAIKNILLVAFGMTLGFPTILIPGLLDPSENFPVDPEGISWIGSINYICVPVGCIISGAVSNYFGRRKAMQIVNIPFTIAWLLFRFSNAEWQIYVALALTGLSGGFLEAPVLTYVAEISQPQLRGMLSSTSTLSVIIGILIMFCLGTFFHWKTVALASCIVNVVSFNLLFIVPESPHWLISKNRLLDARKSLSWLRGWTNLDDIEPEYKEIYEDTIKQKKMETADTSTIDGNMNGTVSKQTKGESCLGSLAPYLKKDFIWRFSLISYVFVLHHFTGMTPLQTYAVQIFESVKAPINKYYATVILGAVELLGCVFCVILVHYAGKRLLNFVSLLAGAACMAAVATYAFVIDVNTLVVNQKSNITMEADFQNGREHFEGYSWIPMTSLIGYAFISHVGMRVLPWILTGELYSNETRAAASGLSSAVSYILGFVANKVFFSMVSLMTLPGVFWFYAVVALIGFVTLYFWLPETEGKTLGQINEHFARGKKMGNNVFRGHKEEHPIRLGTINQAYINESNNTESRF